MKDKDTKNLMKDPRACKMTEGYYRKLTDKKLK